MQTENTEEIKGMFTVVGEPEIVRETRRKVLRAFSELEFYEEDHRYVLHGEEIKTSASSVAHRFIREPFNEKLQAERYAQKHGGTPEHWIGVWRQNSFRATTLGTKTHAFGESLAYLLAGHPERICTSLLTQYQSEYNYLAPIHPKEEAVEKFLRSMPSSLHMVLNEAMVHSGMNPNPDRNLRELISGTLDMLYYYDGDGDPEKAGFMIFDYKTNAHLTSDYNRKWGKMLLQPFNDMVEEDMSLYIIQLSLYALMLEDIGIPIIDRRIVWLKNDGEFELFSLPDVSDRLRLVL